MAAISTALFALCSIVFVSGVPVRFSTNKIDLFLFLIRHNLPSDDFEQGPLADLPDYSYLSKIDWFENSKEGVVF